MRLILMGTGPFALPTFRSLLDSAEHEVTAIVSRPPARGQGCKGNSQSPVMALAERCARPVWTPNDINDPLARAELASLEADLFVVCDFGQILAADTLAAARLGGVNLHGSLLPKYRGAAPVNWAIWNGEDETGVSVIHMTPRLDAGPLLCTCRTSIGPTEDAVQLEERLAQLGIEAVDEALRLLASWNGGLEPGMGQDPGTATRAPRLKKTDGRVDWTRTAQQIFNQVRALKPWPGTYTTWNRRGQAMRLILNEVGVIDEEPTDSDLVPGQIVRSDHRELWVLTAHGMLSVQSIQPAGKRSLTTAEFLRGYLLGVGDHLGT